MVKNIIPTPKSVEVFEGKIAIPGKITSECAEWSEYVNTISDAFVKLFDIDDIYELYSEFVGKNSSHSG